VSIAITGRTALDDREAVLASLREGIGANLLTSEINAVQQRQFQSKAATHLHNTVQSRLTAAALHLEHAATVHDDALAQSSLDQARSVLANVRLRGEMQQDPRERLEEIIIAWSGIATITVQGSHHLIDIDRWHIAVDAIEEAAANAIRHGGAKTLEITVRPDACGLVVSISDDGAPTHSTNQSGFGHQWMTSITNGEWKRERTNTGSAVTLHVAMTPPG
jgi:signal transduction histidine kinase